VDWGSESFWFCIRKAASGIVLLVGSGRDRSVYLYNFAACYWLALRGPMGKRADGEQSSVSGGGEV
jgi:hypothetical protein